MSNLVIVAIPDENDRVWKISSEKVPHLTLLFLGDSDAVANADQIVQFVEHAANQTLRRFYLPVDRRGELGEDPELGPADVLFFKKGRYDYKAIRDFRVTLLKDDNIRTAYDSATQHEGVWLPHLTLGYENRPAKPDDTDRDFGFYDVSFNKIAVWLDDFDGPDFLLKDYWDEWEALESVPMDVAMSDLQHYGVKGMQWGVRRENLGGAAKSVGKAAASAGGKVGKAASAVGKFAGDVSFESRAEDGRAREAVISAANPAFRRTDLPAVKARHGDYGKLTNRAKKPFSKEAKAYRKDAKETYIKRLETAANSLTNVSGDRQYTIRERGWELPEAGGALPKSKHYWDVTTRKVKHAAEDDFTRLEVVFDDEGYISDLKKVEVESSMAQTADLGAEFLAHFGVKGMQWGVRKDQTITVGGETKQVSSREAKKADKGWKASFESGKMSFDDEKFTKDYNSKWDDDFSKEDWDNPSPKYSAYINGYFTEMSRAYTSQVVEHFGSSPTGKMRVERTGNADEVKLVYTEKIKHDDMSLTFKLTLDDKGHIVGAKPVENTMAQTLDLGAVLVSSILDGEALEHYGVKGMRWGQRREAPSAVATSARSVVPHGNKRKTKIEVEGGENHPASSDAIKVAQAKIKLKKSGTSALSNQELRELQERMNLERNVTQLVGAQSTAAKGKKFVKGLVGLNKQLNDAANTGLTTRQIVEKVR